MKNYADQNRNVKIANFSIDDTVLVKQPKVNKLTPPFNPDPHTIVSIKGSMITARSSITQRTITRNSSFFKRIPSRTIRMESGYFSDSDIDIENNVQNESNRISVSCEGEELNSETIPRRNPVRQRNRPPYLQDDIRNLLDT